MSGRLRHGLSKRERQMMEAIYARKSATAAEVLDAIPSPPSYSAVRATLQVLVRKGLLVHRREGRRYLYAPTIPHEKARDSALRHLLDTYFDGSAAAAMAALVRVDRRRLGEKDYRRLLAMIEKVEEEGPP
jgi:BlaI family transcriptional regulator, penicillinase repressor